MTVKEIEQKICIYFVGLLKANEQSWSQELVAIVIGLLDTYLPENILGDAIRLIASDLASLGVTEAQTLLDELANAIQNITPTEDTVTHVTYDQVRALLQSANADQLAAAAAVVSKYVP